MTWERFGYICRKAAASRLEGGSVAERLSQIEAEVACHLYGDPIKDRSWPRKILTDIQAMHNAQEAQEAIDIYQHLNLTQQFAAPMRFKRIVAYLSLIIFVFYSMVTIYSVKLVPVFIDLFETVGQSAPVHLLGFYQYAGTFVIVASLLLLFNLLLGHQLKKLFTFKVGIENSFIIKYLVLPTIRNSYLKVLEILQFPLRNVQLRTESTSNISDHSLSGTLVTEHLREVNAANMSVSKEMQELIEIEMRTLLASCEKQLKLLTILVAVTVLSAVGFFLVSAYSPMFMFGEFV